MDEIHNSHDTHGRTSPSRKGRSVRRSSALRINIDFAKYRRESIYQLGYRVMIRFVVGTGENGYLLTVLSFPSVLQYILEGVIFSDWRRLDRTALLRKFSSLVLLDTKRPESLE